jgi:hypothetical protein
MSYHSKRTIANIVAGILLIAAYVIYALGSHASSPDNLKSWAIMMLVFIGIGVGIAIVIQIIFHIALAVGIAVKEQGCDDKKVNRILSASMVEDEREKLISLKAARVGYICAGTGSVTALLALAFGVSIVAALHIMLGAFASGSIVEGVVSVYFHEKGVRNG